MATATWVLLAYRIPREPSTPRISVWRRLRRLGVLRLGDGLVALPADAETVEAFEWVAELVTEAAGDAWVFTASGSRRQDVELRDRYDSALAADVEALRAEITDADGSTTDRVRREWRRRYRHLLARDRFATGCTEPVRRLLEDRAPRAAGTPA